VLGPVPLDPETIRGGVDALVDELGLVHLPDVVVGLDLAEQERQALREVERAELVEPGDPVALVEDALDVHVERLRLGRFERSTFVGAAIVVSHPLDAQDGHGHGGSSVMSVLPALAIHPPSTMTTSPVWKRDQSLMK